jgi:hypothetical protein
MFKSNAKRESISVKVSDITYEMPVDPQAPPQAPPELLGVHFDTERQVVIFCIAGGANAQFQSAGSSPLPAYLGKLVLQYQ